MAENTRKDARGLSRLYRLLMGLYSAVPYHCFPWGGAFPPLHYYLEVTRRCNLRCRMCQYIAWLSRTSLEEQRAGELTTDEWRHVIDQTGRFSLLTFTGGEPWMRTDFLELLEYACARRQVHCISNCTLLTEDRARRLAELAPKHVGGRGFVSLGVSLDAPGARHDEIRGLKGAFEKATAGVKVLTRHRDERGQRWPMVHVTSVIQESNVDVLPEMPALVRDLGADALNLTTEIRFHDLKGLGEIDPCTIDGTAVALPRIDSAALRESLEATQRAADAAGIELRLPRMPLDEVVRYYSGGVDLKRCQCRMPWTTMTVGRAGGIFSCQILRVGDVRKQSLKTAWNNAQMRGFRQHCRDHLWPICQGCCELEMHE